ncbi:DUF547 domain-containing protein [Marinirhabdus gelatinilytica]|uniref:Uncharacterized protein DUF547 n=1 Tax=Marinirhabdus gelatinilytica TaxID=1703343 RepID=A0A370QL16_9FLAO|nr:DUF547 domain-containing protein [Marinirhabdus gelatinilytica]RDK89056.1 uncharacterized protein DUF547 [Marinirhabdus gelatinilytica]
MKFLKYAALLSTFAFTLHSCNLLSAAGISSQGQPTKKVEGKLTSTTANSEVNVDHSQWTELLQKHVNEEGLVDYKGFKEDAMALDDYLNMLAKKDPNNDWSVQELLAFYINLYNAETVNLILENYPVKSIKDIENPWTEGRARVDGRELSLGGIENGILRKMNEPRIHFAINCASISCPPLIREAYTAAKINEQLDMVTRNFINGPKNKIDANTPELSSIFKFYPNDWKVNGDVDLFGYINQYSDVKINPNATETYLNYDWGLNEQ